jgi:hypothetical protein
VEKETGIVSEVTEKSEEETGKGRRETGKRA